MYAVVVHGFREHLGRHASFVRKLRSFGFSIVGVTLPGHGTGHADILDWTAWDPVVMVLVTAMKKLPVGAPVLLYGHSLGGLVAIDAVRRGLVSPTWLVLSAPFLRISAGLDRFAIEALPVLRSIAPRAVVRASPNVPLSTDPARTRDFFQDPLTIRKNTLRTIFSLRNAQRRAKRADPAPFAGLKAVLVVRGDQDALVSKSAIDAFAARMLAGGVNITALTFPDEGHELMFRSDVQAEVQLWWRTARHARTAP